jgi:glycerate kinase
LRHYFDYMNILICPDKFKDSLTAQQVCEALEIGIKRRRPKSVIQLMPLADGGEGTLEVIKTIHGGEWIQKKVNDPLFRPIEANYLWLADQKIAYIEMSRASGIELLKIKERNPYLTSTFGTGELILDAIEKGASEIILTIGGSATNDAGIGMAAALGFKFLSKEKEELKAVGESLPLIDFIVPSPLLSKIHSIKFKVITDVQNPLAGKEGAAHVFAKQKGANAEMIKYLDKGLINMQKLIGKTEKAIIGEMKGAGAAGGLGAGAIYFLQAEIAMGAEWLLTKIHFDRAVKKADYVITGEGKIDGQTWGGKLISQVIARCDKQFKQAILVCGVFEDPEKLPIFFDSKEVYSVLSKAKNAKDSMINAATYLEQLGEEIALKYL